MKNDTKSKEVPLNNAAVKQKHRMAAGLPVDGQKLPAEPKDGAKTKW